MTSGLLRCGCIAGLVLLATASVNRAHEVPAATAATLGADARLEGGRLGNREQREPRAPSGLGLATLSPRDFFPQSVDAAAVRHRCGTPATELTLDALLACAGDTVAEFERQFSSVVAEERLEQMARVTNWAGYTYTRRRTTRADLLLVEDPAEPGWMPFRDVFEVDGIRLENREDRLRRLFLEPPGTALERARAIAEESARFNIGSMRRTINVPTLPLLFLRRTNQSRFSFKAAGEEPLAGIQARKVSYSERSRPTLIRGNRGANVPAAGSFWVDPVSGCVLATRMDVYDGDVQLKVLVTYLPDAASGLWVPAEMREQYRRSTDAADFVNTRASYSKFRRFQVSVTEQVKEPRTAADG